MDFPSTTKVEVSLSNTEQKILGDMKPFYKWIKNINLSCAFDGVDRSSGLQTLECRSLDKKEYFSFYVEFNPEKQILRFENADTSGEGPMHQNDVGAFLEGLYLAR